MHSIYDPELVCSFRTKSPKYLFILHACRVYPACLSCGRHSFITSFFWILTISPVWLEQRVYQVCFHSILDYGCVIFSGSSIIWITHEDDHNGNQSKDITWDWDMTQIQRLVFLILVLILLSTAQSQSECLPFWGISSRSKNFRYHHVNIHSQRKNNQFRRCFNALKLSSLNFNPSERADIRSPNIIPQSF